LGDGDTRASGISKSRGLHLAAANLYKKDHYDSEEIQNLIKNANFYYVTGFFLTVSPETIVSLGQTASHSNKIFSFNLSAPFLMDFFFDKMTAIFPYTDIVFGNDDEFTSFGKKHDWGTDLSEIAKRTSELPKDNTKRGRVVIVTRGSNPTLIYDPAVGKIEEVPVTLVPKDEIVDVNGAGDSFVGGFLAGLVTGLPYPQCVKSGNYCAGVTIRTSGTDFKGKTPSFSPQ